MVKAFMKNGSVAVVTSKLGVIALSKMEHFKQFRTATGHFTSVKNALGLVGTYNEGKVVVCKSA